jgi:hypothetical protein
LRCFFHGLRPVRESWKPWYIRLSFRRKILKTWRLVNETLFETRFCPGNVWISDGENFDLEELHEMHDGGEGHKIIVIEKEIIKED